MDDQWQIKSYTFANCNCDANCGCQFNLSSTHGNCQFVQGGRIVEGHFNTTPLSGLHWAWMIVWPGEIAEGGGTSFIVIDERADAAQRDALEKIISGEASAPGGSHFAVFSSMCDKHMDTRQLSIEFEMNIEQRTAKLKVPGLIEASGEPLIDPFSNDPFHIALARPRGSFEFTYAEIGAGTAVVSGELPIHLEGSYAQFCVHHYNQDGLVNAA
jgi:hypothetical protein